MSDVLSSLSRASVLLDQNRPDLAAAELRQAIGCEPDNPTLFQALSSAYFMSDHMEDAENTAIRAVELDPDSWLSHQALANAQLGRNKPKQALKSAKRTVELGPNEAQAWLVLAMANSALHDPKQVIVAAERGLELDPDSLTLQSLRNSALANLGRSIGLDEARSTLSADPQNELSHVVLGAALLKSGDHRQAMVHFKEALRIDPNFEGAREGLLEALKARTWIYRPILWYTHMLQRLSGSQQIAFMVVVIGLYFLLKRLPQWAPPIAPYVEIARALLVAMFVFLFVGDPLLNCILRFDRDGRHVLTPHESRFSLIAGVLVLPLAAFWLTSNFTDDRGWYLLSRVTFALFAAVVMYVGITRPKYQRIGLWALGAIVAGGIAFLANYFIIPLGIGAHFQNYALLSGLTMVSLYFASIYANED